MELMKHVQIGQNQAQVRNTELHCKPQLVLQHMRVVGLNGRGHCTMRDESYGVEITEITILRVWLRNMEG